MPVIFSRACEYALKGMIEMARHPDQDLWRIHELAERADVPGPFLAKTFQSLVKAEILASTKGRRGGFSFARLPDRISLLEVVEIIDGPSLQKDCVLGFPTCSDVSPCPFHSYWGEIRGSILDALRNETLAHLAQ